MRSLFGDFPVSITPDLAEHILAEDAAYRKAWGITEESTAENDSQERTG